MQITVKLIGVLEVGRFSEKRLETVYGSTVKNVVENLKLPAEHVDILLVNGKHAGVDQKLADGDVLSIMPMVEGG